MNQFLKYSFKNRRNLCHDSGVGLRIYNNREKRKLPLVLRNPVYSSWYTCGPTVYDSAHIGHASTYVRLDILQRILKNHFDVNLVTCMNITNIDDKIIKKSVETGKSWKSIAIEYEAEFWEDLDSLGVEQPDIKLRVTDEIPKIIKFIESIEEKGFTKVSDDGSVNFKTSSYNNYGKLQNVVLDDSSAADFALWKGSKPDEPSWKTKWGEGRPGWHIECSTLASLAFGSNIDFHAGGVDLRFPHHENEEAQSCVFHGVTDWVTNWIHTGHLHMKGQTEKMSKSLKNTVSIRELLQEHSSDQFRVACLLSHYRSSVEFGPDLMSAADAVLKKLQSFKDDAKAFIMGMKKNSAIDQRELIKALLKCKEEVKEALSDDFNTSKAVGCVSELMTVVSKMINNVQSARESFDSSDKAVVQATVNYTNEVFSKFGVGKREEIKEGNVEMENLIDSIIKVRNEIRMNAKVLKSKELFKVCDSIRDTLKENGIEIKDQNGTSSTWNKNYKKIYSATFDYSKFSA